LKPKSQKILGSQKRTSKSKKNIRKNAWKQKVEKRANHALFLAKYVLTINENLPAEKAENS
jgi:hypothetical protein